MAEGAAAVTRHVAKAAGSYTPVKTDHNQLWRATGAVTLNLTAAATLTTGWALWVKADGGAITIDPSGAETINGAATLTIPDGSGAFIVCTGTAFFAIVAAAGDAVGPSSATDNAIARFDGTTGKLVQNSGVIIDDSNVVTGMTKLTVATAAAGPHITVDRSSTQNAVFEAKTTSGSVFFGQGAANTFAVKNDNNPAASPWFSSTSTAFTINGNTTINGTLTVTG
jgi:hypothetical protein